MGLYAQGGSLYMSSLYQLWRFENILEPGQIHDNYDALYLPQVGYVTGDLDIHDIALGKAEDKGQKAEGKQQNSLPYQGEEKLLFINTLFSCLATVSEIHSFIPLWQPPFISKLAAEDRCGLLVIDLRTGDIVHSLRLEGVVEELYDVAALPGVRRPMAIGFKTDEIRRIITMG